MLVYMTLLQLDFDLGGCQVHKRGRHWVEWNNVEAAWKQLIRWKRSYEVVYWNTESSQAIFTAMMMCRRASKQLVLTTDRREASVAGR